MKIQYVTVFFDYLHIFNKSYIINLMMYQYTLYLLMSYNSITQIEQMDFSVRFWDEEKQQIVNRYLASQFLGHTKASDLLTKFNQWMDPMLI